MDAARASPEAAARAVVSPAASGRGVPTRHPNAPTPKTGVATP